MTDRSKPFRKFIKKLGRTRQHPGMVIITLYQVAAYLIIFAIFLNLPGTNAYSFSISKKYPPLIQHLPISQPTIAPYPVEVSRTEPPSVSAQSIIITDYATGAVLFRKNAAEPRPPASLIKLLTARVALEHCDRQTVVEVPQTLRLKSDESRMGLVPGEKITVENLIYGMLLPSGNDAADVLALTCTVPKTSFVSLLNAKANELGLMQTHITNPSGQDEEGNVTSASDLQKITAYFLGDPFLAAVVRTPYKEVTDTSGTMKHQLLNTNVLLSANSNVFGVKTGTTDKAGQNFITLLSVSEGRKIYLVELGSISRFSEAILLARWVQDNFRWKYPLPPLDYSQYLMN